MLSYWEKASLLHYDVIIIGSGLVGLNTAINLKKACPKYNIAIIERGVLPTGASTRNAGFACYGSLSELLDDSETMSLDELYFLFKRRKQGIQLLRERLGDQAIGFQQAGSHELLTDRDLPILEKMDEMNAVLKDLDENPIFQQSPQIVEQYHFNPTYFKTAIATPSEGSIHTGKMMYNLHALAVSMGIVILTGTKVTHFEEDAQVKVYVEDTCRQTTFYYTCHQLVICTNAFTKQFFPEVDLEPGRGQIVLTKPIPDLSFKGIFHFDRGYYYFRELEGRVLFGGGRQKDFKGEQTTALGSNNLIVEDLLMHLREHILPSTPFEIDCQWSGIMGFGSNKLPIIQQFGDKVWAAFRLGGMGVALGSQVAIDLANSLLEARK